MQIQNLRNDCFVTSDTHSSFLRLSISEKEVYLFPWGYFLGASFLQHSEEEVLELAFMHSNAKIIGKNLLSLVNSIEQSKLVTVRPSSNPEYTSLSDVFVASIEVSSKEDSFEPRSFN